MKQSLHLLRHFVSSMCHKIRTLRNDVKIHCIAFAIGFCIGTAITPLLFMYQSDKTEGTHSDLSEVYFGVKKANASITDLLARQMRILCWVMTAPENHYTKAIHIKNTWGRRCNILLFMSSKADSSLPAIALPVQEGRQYLWQKTREAFKYLYKYYLTDMDWFLKADDDTYVIVENLRLLLRKYNPAKPYFLGSLLWQKPNLKFMYGGSGYILSRRALKDYIEVSLGNRRLCFNPDPNKNEDMYIGKCMEKAKAHMEYTHDDFGRERFLHNNLPIVFDEWGGMECCSDYAITLHYITPKQMYVMDYFLYSFMLRGVTYVPEVLEYRGTLPYKPKRILNMLG